MSSGKGKGKVRPRAGRPPQPGRAALTGLPHRDLLHGELESDPPSAYHRSSAAVWVPYLEGDNQAQWLRVVELSKASEPFLLRGSSVLDPTTGGEPIDLGGLAWGATGNKFRVFCVEASDPLLMEADASKNVRDGPYHVREPKARVLDMTDAEFTEALATWAASKLAVKVPVCVPVGLAAHAGDRTQMALPLALAATVNWSWLEAWRRAQGQGPCAGAEVRAASPGTIFPPRYELQDRLVVQLSGRARVTLFPPTMALEGMYPFPTHHAYDRYSMVDPRVPDLQKWPKFGNVSACKAVLAPSDVLFVPACWFALREELAPGTTLELFFTQGIKALPKAAVALRLSREVEARLGDLEGVQNVKRWVEIVAAGDEARYIDLGTVSGYKRIVVCQGILDDATAVVGEAKAAGFLRSVGEGRLEPTPWLNANFREPLYLTDWPVVIEDDRTDEERRYPELFRHALRERGWSAPEIRQTIPIPGLNVPMIEGGG